MARAKNSNETKKPRPLAAGDTPAAPIVHSTETFEERSPRAKLKAGFEGAHRGAAVRRAASASVSWAINMVEGVT